MNATISARWELRHSVRGPGKRQRKHKYYARDRKQRLQQQRLAYQHALDPEALSYCLQIRTAFGYSLLDYGD